MFNSVNLRLARQVPILSVCHWMLVALSLTLDLYIQAASHLHHYACAEGRPSAGRSFRGDYHRLLCFFAFQQLRARTRSKTTWARHASICLCLALNAFSRLPPPPLLFALLRILRSHSCNSTVHPATTTILRLSCCHLPRSVFLALSLCTMIGFVVRCAAAVVVAVRFTFVDESIAMLLRCIAGDH